jgi:acyl-coenzyme A synthetase/AMP-(fatty) acid ligase
VFVVDEDGHTLMPEGQVGEITLGGAGVARGYYRRPGLTAERFAPNLWGMKSARVFRTGDLGRILQGGIVQCLGRRDSQVKVRGHRVSLGEVEMVLRGHPGVRDAIVTTYATPAAGLMLVGHVVPATADGGDFERELRRHLTEKLPMAAVPQYLMIRRELPVNEHGKVDRKRLEREAL